LVPSAVGGDVVGSPGRMVPGEGFFLAYTRFVIISHLRSGTHLLRTMLESHPALVCQSEPFNSDDPELPYPLSLSSREILDGWVYREFDASIAAAGFVLQIYHPWGLKAFPGIRENPLWGDIWPMLEAMPELRVIHLSRDNGLRRHLSHILARQTGQWHDWLPERRDLVSHLHPPEPDQGIEANAGKVAARDRPAVALAADRLRLDFEEVEAFHRAARERFGSGHYHSLSYEALCAEPEARGQALLRFLHLPPAELKPAVSRLEKRSLNESISNFSELRAIFADTPWAPYFQDTVFEAEDD